MEYDIRSEDYEPLTAIRITNQNVDEYCAEHIKYTDGKVKISDSSEYAEDLRVYDKKHALNIIKALNKAIELGWLK